MDHLVHHLCFALLWDREADRTILTACQQKGANQRTFSAVSAQLGNKTANEVMLYLD